MAALARPTDENYAEAARFVLLGLVSGEELDSIMSRLDQLHLPNNTFPADVLLELGADAIAESGVTQAEPIEYEESGTVISPSMSSAASERST